MVIGFGICDVKDAVSSGYYLKWRDMLIRCYSEKERHRNVTYIDCKVCDDWKYFSGFLEWCKTYEHQTGIDCKNYALDKDLKGCGKLYSQYTCCFLPKSVNTFLTVKRRNNSLGYIGVSYQKKSMKYKAEINSFFSNKRVCIGYYNTAEEAATAYRKEKLKLADEIERSGLLDYDKSLKGFLRKRLESLL